MEKGLSVNSWGRASRLSKDGSHPRGSGWLLRIEGQEDAAAEIVKGAIAKGNAFDCLDGVAAAFGEAIGVGAVKGAEDGLNRSAPFVTVKLQSVRQSGYPADSDILPVDQNALAVVQAYDLNLPASLILPASLFKALEAVEELAVMGEDICSC